MTDKAIEALKVLSENVRHKAGIEFGGLRDNEATRSAIVTLMEFARAALEAKAEPVADSRIVPVQPTEAQWSGLARDIIMWMDMGGRPTGESLYEHLDMCGRDIPQWLRDEVPNVNHVPPKGTRAAIIYKAMIMDMPAPPSTAEAQARALEGFAKKMRKEAEDTHFLNLARAYSVAAEQANAEAMRIREEW
jgi:hypothetical protein